MTSDDLESELTVVLEQEINLEIDHEVLTDLRNATVNLPIWDFESAMRGNFGERYESLYIRVVETSNLIHRRMVLRDSLISARRAITEIKHDWKTEGF